MSQSIHNDGNWQRVDTGEWVSRAEHERVDNARRVAESDARRWRTASDANRDEAMVQQDRAISAERKFDVQAKRIAELDSQLRAMTADRDLWKDDHEGDCPHVARIAELEAERDELECKGKDLCCAYGNALITIHDLREQNARLVEALNSERKDETGRISMEYEVVQDKRHPQDYRAEAIGADGECYSVVFIGPDAEKRAREYALAQKEQG